MSGGYETPSYRRRLDGYDYEWRDGPRGLGWYNDENHWFLEHAEMEVRSGGPATTDENTWGMLAHVLCLFTWFIGPLVIYLAKGNESAKVKANAAEALNFELSLTLASIVAFVLLFVLVGIVLLPVIAVAGVVFPIIGAVKANNGEIYRYPVTIRFVS